MKIYIVVCEDRHTDVQIEVFSDPAKALERAAEIVDQYDEEVPDGEDVWPDELPGGYLFTATVSCEGDVVYVKEGELNEDQVQA